jgi:hypothetical protein
MRIFFFGADAVVTRVRKLLDSLKANKHTVVEIFHIVVVKIEHIVTSHDGVQLVASAEVGSKQSLHRCIKTLDEKAECNRDTVDDMLNSMSAFNGTVKSWASQELELILLEGYVNSASVKSVEVGTNSFASGKTNGCKNV